MRSTITWTNTSQPPNTSRTVRCLMPDGETVEGFYWHGDWLLRHTTLATIIEPAGWAEVEQRKEQHED